MSKTLLTLSLTIACTLAFCVAGRAQESASSEVARATEKIAEAAQSFLATLDDAQRGKVVYDFQDGEQRQRWSNLPSPMVKRGGLRVGDLTPPQRTAVQALLAAALSPEGYEKVSGIVEGDEYLKKNDHGPGPGGPPPGPGGPGPGGPGGGRGRPGGGATFGHDEYYLSFLGQPSATKPWMLQYGGHHLAINITFAGGQSTLAPSHTAAQPAIYELEGKTVRPLGHETDKGYALLSSLDERQRKQAILGFEMRDLVLGPGRDGQTIQPEGIKGSALNEQQRGLLLDLASEWIGIGHASAAQVKMAELKKNILETWFAWSGPVEKGAAAYFRIQGPTVLIEYAPQKLGGDATKHIHTIYRDPTNDYGAKWWK